MDEKKRQVIYDALLKKGLIQRCPDCDEFIMTEEGRKLFKQLEAAGEYIEHSDYRCGKGEA